tara:strand:+ start:193 stop:369 length:177 start_codon:yes stop_codon:yes gene_type:complete
VKNPFVYTSPPPLEGKQLRRFYLMGLPNKQLQGILGKNLHAKKTTLVDLIIEKEYYST